jgi:methylated-DNA-[protein]-cysteine S-methyltransferase
MAKYNTIYTCKIGTPLGMTIMSAENRAITGLWFVGEKYYPTKTDTWVLEPDYLVFETLRAWLSDYFLGVDRPCSLHLEPRGTSFQKAVWNIISKIPFGQITTYGEIAKKIATDRGLSSMSARAVGRAVGHNPISILIPCHRVVGSDRSLTGYAGGLDKKRALLQLEHVDLARVKLAELD